MTGLRKYLLAAAFCAGMAAPALAEVPDKASARLAERLEGRVAGEPVDCIQLNRIQNSTIYDRTALVYEVGSTLYVNRPEAGAESLRRHDIMIIRNTLGQLCDIDVIDMRDSSGFYSGSVFLGKFTPYERASEEG